MSKPLPGAVSTDRKERATGWYWLPAEAGDKADWHPAFYDAERGLMWLAECERRGRKPSEADLAYPAAPLAPSSKKTSP